MIITDYIKVGGVEKIVAVLAGGKAGHCCRMANFVAQKTA
jgi:dihydroxyacetone kinase